MSAAAKPKRAKEKAAEGVLVEAVRALICEQQKKMDAMDGITELAVASNHIRMFITELRALLPTHHERNES